MADDPFYIVKDELCKSLSKIRTLIDNLNGIKEGKLFVSNSKETKYEKISNILSDLKTTIKGVEWDLQDLEETINVVKENPAKFKLNASELEERRRFINTTKGYVQKTKDSLNDDFELKDSEIAKQNSINIRIPDLLPNSHKKGRYIALNNNNYDDSDAEIDNDTFIKPNNDSQRMKQEQLFKDQDVHLDMISNRISSLKNISQTMNTELESQSELLNELGNEMDVADSRMQTVMKKLTKLLHLSTDKGQWTAIGILIGVIVVLIVLFNVIPSKKS